MEIHAPHHPIQSWRDIVLHLAIVTVGILIALGLEQTVEWYHHRQLAAEARETILNEIRSNKIDLDSQIARLAKHRSNAIEVYDFISDMLDHGKSDHHSLHLTLSQARLRNTSWTTAQTVGALAFIPYAAVEEYAAVYHRQDDYLVAQSRAEDVGVGAYSVFAVRNKFEKLSHPQLETERERLMNLISAVTVEIQMADGLTKSYDGLLSGKTDATHSASQAPSKEE